MTPPADGQPSNYRFADLTLDVARRCVTRQGQPIELKALDFDLLRFLVEQAPNVINADVLAEKVWGRHFVSPENVAQRIMLLRQSLNDDANRPRYIETVRNKGYRLVPVVEKVTAGVSGTGSGWRRHILLPAAAVALAVGVISTTSHWHAERPPPLPSSIAVLPFENLSPDPKDAYFATALHAEVINQLVQVRSLNVIRAASVAQYAGSGRPLADIARELNVETLLEATVAYVDEGIVLHATLTNVETGKHLWSHRYDGSLADASGIQADIATQIALALETELLPAQIATLERRPTESAEAYALYLEAVSLDGREASNPQRIALLSRALAFDNRFAAAYARRAVAHASGVVDNTTGDGVSADEQVEFAGLARADAERALELDATNASARFALGMLDALAWRWTSARTKFQAGAEGESGSLLFPIYTFYFGDEAEARRLARRAVTLSPNDWLAYRNLGWVLLLSRDYGGAHEALTRAIELAPHRSLPHRHMAYLEAARGNRAEALKEIRLAEQLLGNPRPRLALAEIAKVYGQLGESQDANRLFDEIMSQGDLEQLGAGTRAAAYLAIGKDEEALEWLRRAAEKARNHEPDQGFWSLLHLTKNITADPTLARQDFAEVLSRIRGY